MSGAAENELNREHKQQQLQLFKVFTAIFIGNLITWMPVLGLALASQAIDFDKVTSEAIAFVYMTYISYALIHPILESWFIVDIRMKVKKIVCHCCNFQEPFSRKKTSKNTVCSLFVSCYQTRCVISQPGHSISASTDIISTTM